jgi:molybdopterin/thiamine biosynthesis adenylyltransferase
MSHIHDSLSRTALLVQRDIYPTLSAHTITEHLASRSLRLRSDERNVRDAAGQAAAITFVIAAAQSGSLLQIDVPDVALNGPQPPLDRASSLGTGLRELCCKLIQPPAGDHAATDLTVLLGDTPPVAGERSIRICGGAFDASVTIASGAEKVSAWSGEICFGAHLGALAASAECFRDAMFALGTLSATRPSPEHNIAPAGVAALALPQLDLRGAIDLGVVDFVSAGAMTNAALAPLLRMRRLRGSLRIIDADIIEASNLNRYALIDRTMIGMFKVHALARLSREGLDVTALPSRLSDTEPFGPLAPRVMLGVDHIPSRWVAQRRAPGWVCVGATSRTEILVSEHSPGGPCTGCMHPYDDAEQSAIPTVSFVSQLAGVLQAHRLLAHALGEPSAAPILAHGLALGGRRPLLELGQVPHPQCPLGCAASGSLAA